MPLRVEILEPGLAQQHRRGYVGLTDPGHNAELVFPHVDTCLALALILNNKRLIGGHVGTQWPGSAAQDRHFCIDKIIALMDANHDQVQGDIVFLVLAGHGNWWHADFGAEVGTALAHWSSVPVYLGVTTDDNAPQGCNIYVRLDSLVVEKFDTMARRTWPNLKQMSDSVYKTNAF